MRKTNPFCKAGRTIAASLLLLTAMCLTGYLVLVLSYCISEERMKAEMQESVVNFAIEGNYYIPAGKQTDNFTDALMLITASHPKHENVWQAAANCARFTGEGMDPADVLVRVYGGQNPEVEDISYGRYWHGYLVFLKPLLVVFNYGQIRELLSMVQIGLFMAITMILVKKKRCAYTVPMLMFWIAMNPVSTMMSLQFHTVTTLTFLAVAAVLLLDMPWKGRMDRWMLFFLTVGGATSYFDLLTFPILTLGVPLSLWLALNDSGRVKGNVARLMGLAFFWGEGYAGLWAGKWILATLVTGTDVIANASEAAKYRLSSANNGISFSAGTIVGMQTQALKSGALFLMAFIVVLAFLFLAAREKIKVSVRYTVSYLIIGTFPLLWYCLMKNHSFVHYWFTFRGLAVTVFAAGMWGVKQLEVNSPMDTSSTRL